MKKIIVGLSLILACVTDGNCILPHQNMPYSGNDLEQILSHTLDKVTKKSGRAKLRKYIKDIQNQDEDIEIRRDSFDKLKRFINQNKHHNSTLQKLGRYYLDVLASE